MQIDEPSEHPPQKGLEKSVQIFARFLESLSGGVLVVAVALMLSLTIINIVLRWLGMSLLWVDPFVRHLVFMSAFLGGVLATGKNCHIGIDILAKVFESTNSHRAQRIHRLILSLASALIVFVLAYASMSFLLQEMEYGKEEFLGLHSSVLIGIMPVGFLLLGLRFLCETLLNLRVQVKA